MNTKDKILFILPHSIAGRLIVSSIKDGFETFGFECSFYDEIYGGEFLEEFSKKDYKYLISYDFTAINLKIKNNIKVKTLNFFGDKIQDPHSGEGWDKLYNELFSPDNLSFFWDKEDIKVENNPQMIYLPHFVNTEIYKNLNLKKEFDVMFMGRLDTDYRLKTFESVLKKFKSVAYYSIERHYKDALSRLPEISKPLLIKAYQGFIDNEEDMATAINKAKIVVNFNEQGTSSLNYRTIQTMSCETMHIGDYRKEGVEYFKENYIYYKNLEEMLEKTEYYLANLDSACKINKEIRKIIEKDFSHRAGAQAMINFAHEKDF